jgi:RNA polymerase sigma-70 factor (ECF subfamily)
MRPPSLSKKIGSVTVTALPPRRQEALVLARFHGLSYEQIAEVMGISVQTVANQLSSALRDLRGVIGKE